MKTGIVLALGAMLALTFVTMAIAQPAQAEAGRVCYVGPTWIADQQYTQGWVACCPDESDPTTCGYGGYWVKT